MHKCGIVETRDTSHQQRSRSFDIGITVICATSFIANLIVIELNVESSLNVPNGAPTAHEKIIWTNVDDREIVRFKKFLHSFRFRCRWRESRSKIGALEKVSIIRRIMVVDLRD